MNPSPTAVRRIEFLFLDRDRCGRCADTERNLAAALDSVEATLREQGTRVEVTSRHVTSADQAAQLRLVSSPTIRIDGADIAPRLIESPCEADACRCADGTAVDCRVWEWQGDLFDAAPIDALRAAILDPPVASTANEFVLPQHLAAFFGEDGTSCCTDLERQSCCDDATRADCCSESGSGCACR